jgi:predicted RNA-binding Zn-ribbon protein involved in translation (DUF1610 family)
MYDTLRQNQNRHAQDMEANAVYLCKDCGIAFTEPNIETEPYVADFMYWAGADICPFCGSEKIVEVNEDAELP